MIHPGQIIPDMRRSTRMGMQPKTMIFRQQAHPSVANSWIPDRFPRFAHPFLLSPLRGSHVEAFWTCSWGLCPGQIQFCGWILLVSECFYHFFPSHPHDVMFSSWIPVASHEKQNDFSKWLPKIFSAPSSDPFLGIKPSALHFEGNLQRLQSFPNAALQLGHIL